MRRRSQRCNVVHGELLAFVVIAWLGPKRFKAAYNTVRVCGVENGYAYIQRPNLDRLTLAARLLRSVARQSTRRKRGRDMRTNYRGWSIYGTGAAWAAYSWGVRLRANSQELLRRMIDLRGPWAAGRY